MAMSPQDFVRQVYLAQTNLRLEYLPTDDKYKEVLEDANLVLAELQKEQDWSWLKERVILGHTGHGHGIPEFELPKEDIYKVGSQMHDGVKLYHAHHGHRGRYRPHGSDYYDDIYSRDSSAQNIFLPEMDFHEGNCIWVPWESISSSHRVSTKGYNNYGQINTRDRDLTATFVGNTVTFNRPLRGRELHRIAVTDCVMRIKPLHICDDECVEKYWSKGKTCPHIEREAFPQMPDPEYIVFKVATIRAEMDPVMTEQRRQSLGDRANKMLSAMRENDSSATTPEVIDYEPYGYYEVT